MRRAEAILAVLVLLRTCNASLAEQEVVWIGMATPAHGEKEGIYRAMLNQDSGALSPPELAAEIGMPEFLALHANNRRLYAACRLSSGLPGVAAFEISEDRRSLRLINGEPTGDGAACHLAVDRSGQCLFSAQYGSGSVAVFPLAPDGRIRPRSALVHHSGSGPDQQRQEGPHPHWVGTDPANRYLFVPDLGTDRIAIYGLDLASGSLQPHGFGKSPAGSGPRHLVFHPNGRFAYVVNELQISVTAFAYDAMAGSLNPLQTIDSLPEELREGPSSAAEICIHPGGRFLYASTRGHDSVSAFRIDPNSGRLAFIEREPIRGSHPRSVNIDPEGKWLLAAGRDSNTISVFRIDPESGALIFNGGVVNSPAPISIEFQSTP